MGNSKTDFGCRSRPTRARKRCVPPQPNPGSCRVPKRGGSSKAARAQTPLRSVEAVVADYIKFFRREAALEMEYYKQQKTLVQAIEIAALSSLPSGKRHPHQRRIPGRVLRRAARALASADFAEVRDFDELHEAVKTKIGRIRGIGALAIYDISHRIGAHLGIEPSRVYVHAGVRKGARALGLGGKSLEMHQLPKAFERLSAAEAEDCLCSYKSDLQRIARWQIQD